MQEKFTSINRAGEKFIGYSRAEFTRLKIADVVAPESLELARRMASRKLSEKIPIIYEVELITKDKQRVTAELSTGIIYKNGEPVAMQGIIHDITTRKRTEREMEKNLLLLTSTFESTSDAMVVADRNNRVVAYNRQFIDIWQFPEEIVNSRDLVAFFNFSLSRIANPEKFIEQTGESIHCPDVRFYCDVELKNGKIYERQSHPQISDGKIVGRVVSYRDITERKRVENTLRQSEANLAAAQRITHLGSWEVDLNTLKISMTTKSAGRMKCTGFSATNPDKSLLRSTVFRLFGGRIDGSRMDGNSA